MSRNIHQHVTPAEQMLDELYELRELIDKEQRPEDYASATFRIAMLHMAMANGIRGGGGCYAA